MKGGYTAVRKFSGTPEMPTSGAVFGGEWDGVVAKKAGRKHRLPTGKARDRFAMTGEDAAEMPHMVCSIPFVELPAQGRAAAALRLIVVARIKTKGLTSNYVSTFMSSALPLCPCAPCTGRNLRMPSAATTPIASQIRRPQVNIGRESKRVGRSAPTKSR